MKLGRFVVDTHVHAQRFAAGRAMQQSAEPTGQAWENLSHVLRGLEPYDNSERLLYDMDCYGVDMCVLLPAFGMTNGLNEQIVRTHPDRFVAVCNGHEYLQRVQAGEVEWSIGGVCDALNELLATGSFVGIGEGSPYMPPANRLEPVSRVDATRNMLRVMEVAQQHGVPVQLHTGCPMGYDLPYSTGGTGPFNLNPLWAHDLASAFPDVTLVLNHGGVQGWWSERLQEDCLHVAASHPNVYLEAGLWWSELYERALADPNIGADKLLWATDWGASMGFHYQPGRYPPVYPVQVRKEGVVHHQVDYWGWSLRELSRLRITQDDMNLILGGNAARIYRLPVRHTRLFRPHMEG
jgi:predicted TIM-barrel fold metal-dependent hydrolase